MVESDLKAEVVGNASDVIGNVSVVIWNVTKEDPARTEEYIPVYDYFDINDRITWMFNTPQQVFPLVVGTVAIAANLLCMVAVIKVRQRWTNLYHFMVSLMMSDILVGVSVLAHIFNWIVNPLYHSGFGPWDERVKSRCSFILIKGLNTMSLNVTLLNLMGMAFDHYIAILYPLHYNITLNKRRSRCIILAIWLMAFVAAFLDLLSPLWDTSHRRYPDIKYNYCEKVWLTPFQEEYTTFCIAAICFIVMLTLYLTIYHTIRLKHRNNSGFETRDGRIRDKSKHNTRALLTTLLILGTFALCWLPMCFFQIILIAIAHLKPDLLNRELISTLTTVDQYLYAAFLLNTICDPIIYVVRIRDVRHGILLTLSKFLPKRLRHKVVMTSYERELRNASNYSISLLSERRGTQISATEDAAAGEDREQRLRMARQVEETRLDAPDNGVIP